MIDFMLDGFFKLFSSGIAWVFDQLGMAFTVNLAEFENTFPALKSLSEVMTAAGWSIILLLLVISVIKSMATPNDQYAEHPLMLVGRAVIAGAALAFHRPILDLFFGYGDVIYQAFNQASTDPSAEMQTMGDYLMKPFEKGGVVDGLVSNAAGGTLYVSLNSLFSLVSLIMMLAISWQMIKFVLECLGRYVTLCISGYFAPLAIPTLTSKSTSNIFSSYCSFVVGQMLLMWMSAMFMRLIISGFASFGTADSASFFFHFFLLYSIVVLAQKADNILTQIGFRNILGGASTGTALAGAALAAVSMVKTVASTAIGAAKSGKASGGSNGGSAKPTAQPQNGGARIEPYKGGSGGVPVPGGTPAPGAANTPQGGSDTVTAGPHRGKTEMEASQAAEASRSNAAQFEDKANELQAAGGISQSADMAVESDGGGAAPAGADAPAITDMDAPPEAEANLPPADLESVSPMENGDAAGGEAGIPGEEYAPPVDVDAPMVAPMDGAADTGGIPVQADGGGIPVQGDTGAPQAADASYMVNGYRSLARGEANFARASEASVGGMAANYTQAAAYQKAGQAAVEEAANSFADAVASGQIGSIPKDTGLTISGSRIGYTSPNNPGAAPVTGDIAPHRIMNAEQAAQVVQSSKEAAGGYREIAQTQFRNLPSGDTARVAEKIGYQQLARGMELNQRCAEASIAKEYTRAVDLRRQAETEISKAASSFARSGNVPADAGFTFQPNGRFSFAAKGDPTFRMEGRIWENKRGSSGRRGQNVSKYPK